MISHVIDLLTHFLVVNYSKLINSGTVFYWR